MIISDSVESNEKNKTDSEGLKLDSEGFCWVFKHIQESNPGATSK